MIISFEVPGKITGKQRARVTRWGTHTPEATVLYENLIKSMFLQKTGGKVYSDYCKPVELNIKCFFAMPASWSKKKRRNTEGLPCMKNKDLDNIIKAVADGLNQIAYKDDAQVYKITAYKTWSVQERIEVEIIYQEDL